MNECERCRAKLEPSSYELFDYCAVCGKNMCPSCMEKGCCGYRPATSGMKVDEAADG